MGYHYRRPPRHSRNPRLEFALTVFVLTVLMATLALFLLVYHDLPFRVS